MARFGFGGVFWKFTFLCFFYLFVVSPFLIFYGRIECLFISAAVCRVAAGRPMAAERPRLGSVAARTQGRGLGKLGEPRERSRKSDQLNRIASP